MDESFHAGKLDFFDAIRCVAFVTFVEFMCVIVPK